MLQAENHYNSTETKNKKEGKKEKKGRAPKYNKKRRKEKSKKLCGSMYFSFSFFLSLVTVVNVYVHEIDCVYMQQPSALHELSVVSLTANLLRKSTTTGLPRSAVRACLCVCACLSACVSFLLLLVFIYEFFLPSYKSPLKIRRKRLARRYRRGSAGPTSIRGGMRGWFSTFAILTSCRHLLTSSLCCSCDGS